MGTELMYQLLAQQGIGEEEIIEKRPDWQAALERSRADFPASRIILHEEVESCHRSPIANHLVARSPHSAGDKRRDSRVCLEVRLINNHEGIRALFEIVKPFRKMNVIAEF